MPRREALTKASVSVAGRIWIVSARTAIVWCSHRRSDGGGANRGGTDANRYAGTIDAPPINTTAINTTAIDTGPMNTAVIDTAHAHTSAVRQGLSGNTSETKHARCGNGNDGSIRHWTFLFLTRPAATE
jgi:hypothetical protein